MYANFSKLYSLIIIFLAQPQPPVSEYPLQSYECHNTFEARPTWNAAPEASGSSQWVNYFPTESPPPPAASGAHTDSLIRTRRRQLPKPYEIGDTNQSKRNRRQGYAVEEDRPTSEPLTSEDMTSSSGGQPGCLVYAKQHNLNAEGKPKHSVSNFLLCLNWPSAITVAWR
jgi:hypothetical protein